MAAMVFKAFRGAVPRTSKRLIGDTQAQIATNCKITSGKLEPLHYPLPVYAPVGQSAAIKTIYQYEFEGVTTFFTWPRRVSVVRSPTAQDYRGRVYFTGDGEPRMTTAADAVQGAGSYPVAAYTLGVTAPSAVPTVAVTGGTAPTENRAYLVTFYNQYDEESATSPATLATGNVNGTWTVSGFNAPPLNTDAITTAAAAAGFATITTASTYGLTKGDEVTIAGAGIAINGAYPITSIDSATQFKIKTAVVGTGAGGTWARVAPHNLANLKRRIYRASGIDPTYRLVAEIPAAQNSYADTVLTSTLVTELGTLDTELPPKDLHSLISLPNGSLAGLSGSELCFSEAYKPHSWPIDYRYTLGAHGVALAAIGNSVIVLTDTYPILATATVPEAVSLSQIETYAPCISSASCVDIGEGAVYASHDGLYLAAAGAARRLTANLYRRDEWVALNPKTFTATVHDKIYYATHTNGAGQPSTFLLDLEEPDSTVNIDAYPSALYASELDGVLYVAFENVVYAWDDKRQPRWTMTWRSKEHQQGYPVNFAVAQVYADYSLIAGNGSNAFTTQAAALNSQAINAHGINGGSQTNAGQAYFCSFTLLARDVVVYTHNCINDEPFCLPAGYTSDTHTVQINSNIPIYSIAVAESMAELRTVV